jgi:hypothetical protein
MKPAEGKAILDSVLKRGWVRNGDKVLTPSEATALNLKTKRKVKLPKAKRTGWIDDDLNLRNLGKNTDVFIRLVKLDLDLVVWPEFYFTLEKQYRFDYAIPVAADGKVLKIAIEVEGGIWAKGNSGHSSGTGIARDMKKSTLANINGWTLIRCTPTEINKEPGKIIELIKKALLTIQSKTHLKRTH